MAHNAAVPGNGERDLVWDSIREVAGRLHRRAEASGYAVRAARRRSVPRRRVTEGIEVTDRWNDVWEPVRWRRLLGRQWHDVQTVPEAAARVGRFLRARNVSR